MDKFVQDTAGSGCTDKSIVMDYYDGNTVTALWNYAQHYLAERQLLQRDVRSLDAGGDQRDLR